LHPFIPEEFKSRIFGKFAQAEIGDARQMGSSVIRLKNGGRLDFWTLGNEIAGRSRRYRRVVIDEAAFAKNGDNKVDGSMMEIWENAIKPTLFDYGGEVLICSNSAGKNPDNFFYNICIRRIPCKNDG
jgi:hypothetical protein